MLSGHPAAQGDTERQLGTAQLVRQFGESVREGAQSRTKEFVKSYLKKKSGEIGLLQAEWVCCGL